MKLITLERSSLVVILTLFGFIFENFLSFFSFYLFSSGHVRTVQEFFLYRVQELINLTQIDLIQKFS